MFLRILVHDTYHGGCPLYVVNYPQLDPTRLNQGLWIKFRYQYILNEHFHAMIGCITFSPIPMVGVIKLNSLSRYSLNLSMCVLWNGHSCTFKMVPNCLLTLPPLKGTGVPVYLSLLTLSVAGAIGKYTKWVNAHSNLCDITLVVTKVHVVLRNFVVLK